MSGLWNDHLNLKDLTNGDEERVFEVNKRPPLSERMYDFGYFEINLNYIDDYLRQTLPPTDSRRRTDQRLMEEGDLDRAAEEKHRLEEKQRAARK